ncbi:TolC family protein [Phenylobacterium sp. 20VBR1]|uniref:TolC family protein n=1 Tax=Phenylobacterium glaciei TaxID=2803784 RepID=A0A941HXT3_9CAUL|nr:TolC family protein [Phenylobacterium glaciei]MBR7620642.1 TolC family protein [Phenylobacterium glaciei]
MKLTLRMSLAGLFLLSACQTYTPAPPRLDAYPAAAAGRSLTPPASGQWTVADLLAFALAYNPQIAEAAAKVRTAQATVQVAHVPQAATLTLTAEYSDEAAHWLYGVGSDIPLDIGARKSGRIGQAELAALQARYDHAEVVWTVRAALARAVTDRQSADAEIAIAGRAADLRRQRAERLDRRVAVGEDPRSLALTAHAEQVAAERRLADARGRRRQADVVLAKALGVAATAVADLNLAPPASATPDWRSLREQAPLTRKDVLRAVVDYDLAESALRTEVARQYPEVRIGPGYTYDHGVQKIPFNLTLVLPPLDLNRAAIAQAEARRTEAGRSLEAVQATVLAAADQAAASLATARDAEQLARDRDLPIARQAAQGSAAMVRAGEGDRIDDLAAQAAVLDAELALLDARRAHHSAILDLEDALRTPFDPAEHALLQDSFRRLGVAR